MLVSPTEEQVFTVLGDFLTAIITTPFEVVRGQVNRVPEPKLPNYVIMTPLRMPRLRTNVEAPIDALITGSIAGTVLTVTQVITGSLGDDRRVFGTGVTAGTTISSQLTGSAGGIGTYRVSPSQAAASQPISAGTNSIEQGAEWVVQLDVHGPLSANNAQVISTLFRSPYACDFFREADPRMAPLLADNPRQMPFTSGESQYEWRWIVEARMQVNQAVVIPQEFADMFDFDIIEVDAAYPPT